jgi:hypothetical protein
MSRLLGKELPDSLLEYLGGKIARQARNVILVVTVDPEGWPHVAMLSHWEVLARDKRNIRMATYASSSTTANLQRTGKTTLVITYGGTTYYIKTTAALLLRNRSGDQSNCIFNLTVDKVLQDELQGTEIATGITYSEKGGAEPHRLVYEELRK